MRSICSPTSFLFPEPYACEQRVSKLVAKPEYTAFPVIVTVMLARLTAPSSSFPKCPMVKILATVREYCKRKVTISGNEYFPITLASRCHVV